jgi:two-component system OmpR family sensor kinase
LPDGLHTLTLEGEPFRVLVKTLTTGERLAVAQETGVRNEIARNSALRTVMPFLLLMPLLLFMVSGLVRKMFRPIALLAVDIDRRGDQELHPMPDSRLPSEIRPFVTAINRLLNRVARSMEAQGRFVADAAHELRSPLTALSLQSERLAQADMSDSGRERLNVLRQGIERARSLLDQLLTLARAQSTADEPASSTSVLRIYRHVLEELMPLAEAKHIDIGVEGDSDVQLQVHEMNLQTIVKNLVDNAIRYTPAGGRIDLSVSQDHNTAILQIRDSGPGIPVTEQKRVFDPFYRVLGTEALGSGLGLSIVQSIAHRVGAQVQLGYADEKAQTGLSVKILIPITRV